MKCVYLASPYNHPDETVKKARVKNVTKAAFELFKQGVYVFSPLTHNVPLIDLGLENRWEGGWESYDLGMLARMDGLYVLMVPGWEESRGVRAEIAHATELGLPIEYLAAEKVGL